MAKIRVGLFGMNGHQIASQLVDHPAAELVAVAGLADTALPAGLQGVPQHEGLAELLADESVELVSLCSPSRSEQAAHAVACMKAGKHVYAEKPCAMTEKDLDAIIATAARTGRQFHEMGGTLLQQPYRTMREAVQAGAVGEVVQVLAQKSYPWADWRAADENQDGGLAMQVGVYATRFVEHIACQTIVSVKIEETRLGNDFPGSECRRAVSFLMTLNNGGLASAVCNYLNPMGNQLWGYEILRIFGTDGILESSSDGPTLRLIRSGEAPRMLDLSAPSEDYFDLFIASLQGRGHMPLTLEEELSPTRWVIRVKKAQ